MSADITQTLSHMNDLSQQASSMFFNGNITSLADLITNSTKQIYKNYTDTPKLSYEEQETLPQDLQASFITDRFASHSRFAQVDISEQDQQSLVELARQTANNVGDMGQDTKDRFKDELDHITGQISSKNLNLGGLFSTITQLLSFALSLVIEKLLKGVLLIFDVAISLLDKILRTPIRLPWITDFYQNVVLKKTTGKLTLYDIFALSAAVPVTVMFRTTHKTQNMFTEPEADILVNTENPEYYVDNLVNYGMLAPNQNATALRTMYRRSVSYVLGSGYSTATVYSALMGIIGHHYWSLWMMRAPFELMAIFCNYPWSWYTNTVTKVS